MPTVDLPGFKARINDQGRVEVFSPELDITLYPVEGSLEDFSVREVFIKQGLMKIEPTELPNCGDLVPTTGRPIEASLVTDFRPMSELIAEYEGHAYGMNSSVPAKELVMRFLRIGGYSAKTIRYFDDLDDSFFSEYHRCKFRQIEDFITIALWGGEEFLRYKNLRKYTPADNFISLYTDGFRAEVPVERMELVVISQQNDKAFDWNYVTVAEAAQALARDSVGYVEIYPRRLKGKLPQYKINSFHSRWRGLMRPYRKGKEPSHSLAWAMLEVDMRGQIFISQSDRELISSVVREVAKLCTYDEALPYLRAGMRDAKLIRKMIDQDIDPELSSIFSAA